MLQIGTKIKLDVQVIGLIEKDRGNFYRLGHVNDPREGGNYIDVHENFIVEGDEEGDEMPLEANDV